MICSSESGFLWLGLCEVANGSCFSFIALSDSELLGEAWKNLLMFYFFDLVGAVPRDYLSLMSTKVLNSFCLLCFTVFRMTFPALCSDLFFSRFCSLLYAFCSLLLACVATLISFFE